MSKYALLLVALLPFLLAGCQDSAALKAANQPVSRFNNRFEYFSIRFPETWGTPVVFVDPNNPANISQKPISVTLANQLDSTESVGVDSVPRNGVSLGDYFSQQIATDASRYADFNYQRIYTSPMPITLGTAGPAYYFIFTYDDGGRDLQSA